MTYSESLEYIKKLSQRGSRPGLERIKKLLSLIGDPQKNLRCIHVAGTNGKGSVCAMLSSILTKAGYSVGMFTTPHLEKVNEMFRYNGQEITDDLFADICTELKPACEKSGATEYEFYSAAAFYLFDKLKTDIVIIECCMGGLLDATNVIDAPLLTVITGIANDHTAFLGPTLSDIAYHKAGIIKESCPVIVRCDDDDAFEVISQIAAEKNAPCTRITEYPELTQIDLDGLTFDCSLMKDVRVPLAGAYQKINALTAIYCSKALSLKEDDIRRGLSETAWKGRFEVLCNSPLVIYDGCHNVQGCLGTESTLTGIFGEKKFIFITGVMRDKEYTDMARIMSPHAGCVYTVSPSNPRALPAKELSKVYEEYGVHSVSCNNIESAVSDAFNMSESAKIPIFIFGSLYMYKDIMAEFKKYLLKSGE